jgi:ubiquinone/menaquinone biosynthesis C-methylase UbiE
MDITRIDPKAALFACRGQRRASKGYLRQFVSWMPVGAGRVLDVGSGTGALALQLAGRASFVVGVDTSPTMIGLARKSQTESGKANVAWVIASADALPFPTATFDYITSTYALRLSTLDRSLPEIRRTIKPGGRVAISDNVSPAGRFRFWIDRFRRTRLFLPQLLRLYGWRGTWHIVAYQLGREGVQHDRQTDMDVISFMEVFQRYFPEKERRFIFSPGRLFWENAPERRGLPSEASGNVLSRA